MFKYFTSSQLVSDLRFRKNSTNPKNFLVLYILNMAMAEDAASVLEQFVQDGKFRISDRMRETEREKDRLN